jgi:hypothetical protein
MDRHVENLYRRATDDDPGGRFHEVIALHEAPDIPWRILSKKVPLLPRGWYELSLLPAQDRIEFCRDYWISKLPYQANLSEFLCRFFGSLDDIGIYLTQDKWGEPFDVNMVYSISGDRGFYSGELPASEEKIIALQENFPNYILPEDYKAFLLIHDGFWKATDSTGLTPSSKMKDCYKEFQQMIQGEPPVTTSKGAMVNPGSLIPFYESFGIHFYQCFWGEWYPQQEMGNVYFSHTTKTISDVKESDSPADAMAFPSFLAWLMFYLERVE